MPPSVELLVRASRCRDQGQERGPDVVEGVRSPPGHRQGALADVVVMGGSFVEGMTGHNPLEPARLAVPVVMGPHYENFRDAVELLRGADALRVVERSDVSEAIVALLADTNAATAMGARGKKAFEEQAGATEHAVEAVVRLLAEGNA